KIHSSLLSLQRSRSSHSPSLIFFLIFFFLSSYLFTNNEQTSNTKNQTSPSPDDTVAATPPAPSLPSGSERRRRLVDAAGARGHRRRLPRKPSIRSLSLRRRTVARRRSPCQSPPSSHPWNTIEGWLMTEIDGIRKVEDQKRVQATV
ncbi:hypothetical protein LINPERPRIM_LOCUS27387, partial [Linum perenne]